MLRMSAAWLIPMDTSEILIVVVAKTNYSSVASHLILNVIKMTIAKTKIRGLPL